MLTERSCPAQVYRFAQPTTVPGLEVFRSQCTVRQILHQDRLIELYQKPKLDLIHFIWGRDAQQVLQHLLIRARLIFTFSGVDVVPTHVFNSLKLIWYRKNSTLGVTARARRMRRSSSSAMMTPRTA